MDESIWAKLETKVRKLVLELLGPTVHRVAEHKETLEKLRRTDESLSMKIETLDKATNKIMKKLTTVEDFSRKLIEFDATMQVHEITFAQDREAIKNELSVFLNELTNSKENISNLIGQAQTLRADLTGLTFDTNNSKASLSSRIEEVRKETLEKFLEFEYKHAGLDNYTVALENKFNYFLKDFEIIDVLAKKADHSIEEISNQLKRVSKSFASYKKESKDIIEKIRKVSMQFSQTAADQIKELKEKFTTETPIQTQLIISENLHSVLDIKEKKLLAELEMQKFAEWEVMLTDSPFESNIKSAKERTQEVLDKPIPKTEKIVSLQSPLNGSEIKENASSSQEKNRIRRESKLRNSLLAITETFKKERKEGRETEDQSNEINEKKLEEKPEMTEKNSLKTIGENELNRGTASLEFIKIGEIENNREPIKSALLSEDLGDKEITHEILENNEINIKARPFDINDIKEHTEEILEILGINEWSEEIFLISEEVKKIQDLSSQVKRLQQSGSNSDEKVQILIKNQLESTQKIEELKTAQLSHSIRCEADKKTAEESDAKILEKMTSLDVEEKNRINELSKAFSVLDREVNNKLLQLTERFENLTKSTQDFLDEQEKTLQVFYDEISKNNQILNLQIQQAALECKSAATQRKRDFHDTQSEFRKIQSTLNEFSRNSDQVKKQIKNFSRTVSLLIEFSKVAQALMQQDEYDRESIALFGVKDSKAKGKSSIIIDKKCITCSGQPNLITNAFKLACLAYSPTSITFKDTVYERLELIEILKKIVEGVSEDKKSDFTPPADSQKHTVSARQVQFRAYSRHSNISLSQSFASASPDLPPLSFPKRLS